MCKFLPLAAVLLLTLAVCPAAAEETWYDSPSLSIMTGFIYEPLKPYTIDQWKETLGNEFDASISRSLRGTRAFSARICSRPRPPVPGFAGFSLY